MNESRMADGRGNSLHEHPESSCLIHAPSRKKASEWSLVLTSREIPHEIREHDGLFELDIPSTLCHRARSEILAYEHENRNWPPPRVTSASYRNADQCIFTMLMISAIMALFLSPDLGALREAGAAWAGKIVKGEWWRAATALTIHAGPSHLLGNMLTGGFIMVHACGYMGSGVAWFIAVASGIAGNLINAFLQPSWHVSVGSSTAIFGITGGVTAYRAVQQKDEGLRGYLVPLGAGLALLGFTGTAGKHTDLAAHACGFVSGLVFGAMFGFAVLRKGKPSSRSQRILAIAAMLLPATAWIAALNRH